MKLHIDDSVQPVAQTHRRRVPFHVRKDLEAQLEADEALGSRFYPNCLPGAHRAVKMRIWMKVHGSL